MTRMTAATITRYALPPAVTIAEVPVPEPADDQVLIAVEAASLNALDWHLFTGTPRFLRLVEGLRRPKRSIPGADIAGEVVAVGAEVTDLEVGDRVFGETAGGGCAPFTLAKPANLARIPDGVSAADAAATPVAGLTALQGLVTHGGLVAGERLLINGAAGGVGTFTVQLAVALGAEVTAVCSTRNVAMVSALGERSTRPFKVVDYTADDVIAMSLGQNTPFDLIFDNVGNRSPAEMRSILTPEGRYLPITGPKSDTGIFGPAIHIARSFAHFAFKPQTCRNFTAAPNRADLETLAGHLADGSLVPQIHETIKLDGVADALALIGTGHTPAKILVKPD